MKAKKAAEAKRLEDIPNIGKSIANDLRGIGIKTPTQLKGNDGLELYHKLNKTTGVRYDPCVANKKRTSLNPTKTEDQLLRIFRNEYTN